VVEWGIMRAYREAAQLMMVQVTVLYSVTSDKDGRKKKK
jgi:hypothetical protein